MQRGTYSYSVYGLNVESLIPLPELPPGRGRPDVIIQYGSVPTSLQGAEAIGGFYQGAPGCFLLLVEGVARYLVIDGKQILIEREQSATDEEVGLFLLGCAFASLLQQQGLLPLHSSGIVADGNCIAFLGPSGTGKSTLAGAFLKRGYRILTDDICVISLDSNGSPVAYPGYPQLKLWMDTAGELGEDLESLARISPGIDKFRRPIGEEFYEDPLPMTRLYVLGVSDACQIEVAPMRGAEKLRAIIGNTYHLGFLDGLGKRPEHFRQCHALAEKLNVCKVTRPRAPFLLDELVGALEADFS
ncbi:hypothetical protein ACFL2Q_10445 [Thermodesulfobacteriota bacterium]